MLALRLPPAPTRRAYTEPRGITIKLPGAASSSSYVAQVVSCGEPLLAFLHSKPSPTIQAIFLMAGDLLITVLAASLKGWALGSLEVRCRQGAQQGLAGPGPNQAVMRQRSRPA